MRLIETSFWHSQLRGFLFRQAIGTITPYCTPAWQRLIGPIRADLKGEREFAMHTTHSPRHVRDDVLALHVAAERDF